MDYPIIAYLVLVVVTLPRVEGQFPRVCTDRDSLRDKTCCPTPRDFTTQCGYDGGRGQCQALTIRDWTSKYSHYRPFQMEDERHNWPRALYNKVCICNANYAGYDCSKCAFGYYGKNCTQKKNLIRRNFLNLTAEEKDRFMRYVNMSKHYVSDFVVTSTPYKKINKTVMEGGDPKSYFYDVTYCSRGYITMLHVTPFYLMIKRNLISTSHTMVRDFPHGIGCTCWHGREPCRKLETMKNLPFLSGTGLRIPLDATPQFALKSSLE